VSRSANSRIILEFLSTNIRINESVFYCRFALLVKKYQCFSIHLKVISWYFPRTNECQMKYLITQLLLFIVVSCEKQSNDYCYRCTFGVTVGSTIRPPLDTCSSTPSSSYQFTDANGNDLSFICQPR
jgi:hypothetical protein